MGWQRLTPKDPMTPFDTAPPHVAAAYKRLTPKLRAFALALPTAESQEAAALSAGYGAQHARKNAATMAKHPDVAVVVHHLVHGAIQAAQDDVETLIRELCNVALADPIGAFNDDGSLKPLSQWPESLRRSLSSFDVTQLTIGEGVTGALTKPRFWDKLRAIEQVAKIRGYLQPEKHEHVHRVDGLAGLLSEIDGAGLGPSRNAAR